MRVIRTVNITLAESIVPNGAKKPLKVLGEDGNWYIAKLRGAERMGPVAFFRELSISKLATEFNLFTPEPVEIVIHPELVPTCVGKDFW